MAKSKSGGSWTGAFFIALGIFLLYLKVTGGTHVTSAVAADAVGPVTTIAQEKAYAYRLLDMDSSQDKCLDDLWKHESGWRVTAQNPDSPAYGIPQADPGDKMSSAGADWQTSATTQIRWGLGYIKGRYGTPCAAWSFEMSHKPNWY